MKKRKDGRYVKKITIDGKQKSFYGDTQAEVYYKIRQFEEKQEVGRSFSEVADEFQEDCESRLVPGSIKTYLPCIERARKYFGDTPIKDITPSMVNKFLLAILGNLPYNYLA